MIGATVAHYRIDRRLGSGGMGEVWSATDVRLGREVAIKFVAEGFASDPRARERFEREARAASSLRHPNIATLLDVGEHDGRPFLVLELLEGETLHQRLRSGPLPFPLVVSVATQIADALVAAHARGIVHRDIKPANVFLTPDDRAVVLDFGLAKRAREGDAAADAPTVTSALTSTGEAVGTVAYMSPEQARGEEVDPRTDLFSLGCVMYETATGRRPFDGPTAPVVFEAILNRDPGPPSAANPQIPVAFDLVVRRALEKDRERRYPSAGALRADLVGLPFGPRRGARRSKLGLAGTAVAGGALLVAAALVFVGRTWFGPPSQPVGAASTLSVGEPPSPVPEANEYLEKAMLFMRVRFDLARARPMLDRAIELDPDFGTARAIRALTFLISIHEGSSNESESVYRSEREARDLLASHADLPSVHATLGAAYLYLNRKDQARAELGEALRLDPRSQSGNAWLAIVAHYSGRYPEAETRARGLLEKLPLFFPMRTTLAEVLFETGRPDEARAEIVKVLEQDPQSLSAACIRARLDLAAGDVEAARRGLEASVPFPAGNWRARLTWALLLAREGKREEARAVLDSETLRYADLGLFAAVQAAEAYASMGDEEEALDWLDRAVRRGDERAAWLRADPFLASLRDRPRFRSVVGIGDTAN